MRKGILLILVCMMVFSVHVESKSNDLKFVIIYDSKEKNKIEKKKEIVELINETLKNVSEKSWDDLLLTSTDELENENRDVFSYDTTIYFKLGDGLGIRIEGNIVSNSFCMAEVKPRSLLRKWFNF